MKQLNSDAALMLLKKDVIKKDEDLFEEKNKWIWHCLYVGEAAGRIATKLSLDSDKAKSLGYIHDIGRKIDHNNHAVQGFYYVNKHGYEEESKICLTHSFIMNELNLVAGGEVDFDTKFFLNKYVNKETCSIYDMIVQLCDLFCTEKGFTTMEKRLLDIYDRKGIFSNTKDHFEAAIQLKEDLESVMGCSLYSLFPEISKSDIENIDENHAKVVKLIEKSQNKVNK